MNFSLIILCSLALIVGINANTILSDRGNNCPSASVYGTNPSSSKHSDCFDVTLSLRGGEVLEPSTLTDVESIIMRASNEGKLVVIDFSATWCGPCKMISPLVSLIRD